MPKVNISDQHIVLHEHWPDDCCLCHLEEDIQAYKSILTSLGKILRDCADLIR